MQYGNMALRALCLRGGKASQAELESDIGIPADRLGPVLAGLHHNGYIVRGFTPGAIDVTLTDEGRQWAIKRGLVTASGEPPPPPSQQRVVEAPRRAPVAAARPAAPTAAARPAPTATTVRLAEGEPGRRRTLTMRAPTAAAGGETLPAVDSEAPAAAPEAAPTVVPQSVPEAPPPSAVEVERRRPRRRKTAAETEEQGEVIATDDSGFVTHIKGKAIY